MNEIDALLGQLHFNRSKTLSLLKQMEDSHVGIDGLYWRMPFGKGRAHIAWQFLHVSATYHKFAHYVDPENIKLDEDFVNNFGHGSKPDETKKFTIEELKNLLTLHSSNFYNAIQRVPIEKFHEVPSTTNRSYREMFHLMNWHESSHIGQCQITWNAYRASKNLMD